MKEKVEEEKKYVAMRFPSVNLEKIDRMAQKANMNRTSWVNAHFRNFFNLKRKMKAPEIRYSAGNIALLEQFFGI